MPLRSEAQAQTFAASSVSEIVSNSELYLTVLRVWEVRTRMLLEFCLQSFTETVASLEHLASKNAVTTAQGGAPIPATLYPNRQTKHPMANDANKWNSRFVARRGA